MNTATAATPSASILGNRPQLDDKPGFATVALFNALLVGGAIYTAMSLSGDVAASASPHTCHE